MKVVRLTTRLLFTALLAGAALQVHAEPPVAMSPEAQKLNRDMMTLQAEMQNLRRTVADSTARQQEQLDSRLAAAQARQVEAHRALMASAREELIAALQGDIERVATDAVSELGGPIVASQVQSALSQRMASPEFQRLLASQVDRLSAQATAQPQYADLRVQAAPKAVIPESMAAANPVTGPKSLGESLSVRGKSGGKPAYTVMLSYREESEARVALGRLRTIRDIAPPIELRPVEGVYTLYVGPYSSSERAKSDADRIGSVLTVPVRVLNQNGQVL